MSPVDKSVDGGDKSAAVDEKDKVQNANSADSKDAPKTENVEIQEDAPQVMLKGNLILVVLPLDKMPRAQARGLLLEVDDMVRNQYMRMEAEKRQKTNLIVPASTGIKGKLAKIFK